MPNCVMEIDVIDTDDALSNLTIVGDENVFFSFCAPGTQLLEYTFALDTVELVEITGTQKGKQYKLHGVGKETMFSKTNYIQKSYNTDISSIIQDIHSNFLNSVRPLITEATQGIQKIIIPNLKPFEAIDMVRRRATSATNQSSTFLYFENAAGHNFKTVEGMFNSGMVKNFVHQDAVGWSIYINTWNNIIDYSVPKIVSSTERIGMGGMTQSTSTFNMRTRAYDNKVQNMSYGNFNSSFFKDAYGALAGAFHLLPIDTAKPPTNLSAATPMQSAYVSNLLQVQMNILVYGDTIYKAGDIVGVNIPQAIATTGTQQTDPLLSQNYLISSLCRSIDLIDKKPRYTDSMELICGQLANGVS